MKGNRGVQSRVVLFVLGWISFASFGGAPLALADSGSFRAQARLFFGYSFVNPSSANTLMTAQSLQNFDRLGQPGVEITYPVARFLDVGLRYGYKFNTMFDNANNNVSANFGAIKQHAFLLIARVPILRTSVFKFDIFGGAGGTNSTFEVKSSTLDGKYSKSATNDWFASPYFAAGASAGIGFNNFYFFAEAGYEKNSVSKLSISGNVPTSVTNLELSGPYGLVGILFDGITVTKQ